MVYGERRLVVLVREGAWGARDFDPESSARRALRGLRVTSYDPRRTGARMPPRGGFVKTSQRLKSERHSCADRPFGRILPLSACQGHGVFGIPTAGP